MNGQYLSLLALECKEKREKLDTLIVEMDDIIKKEVTYYMSRVPTLIPFMEDLMNLGREGVVKAVETYNNELSSFSTYAKEAIRIEIRSFISKDVDIIKVPKDMKRRVIENKKSNCLKNRCENEEKASRSMNVLSLDVSFLNLPASHDTEEIIINKNLSNEIIDALRRLDRKEEYIIIHSFALFDNEKYSSSRIAKELNISLSTLFNKKKRALFNLSYSLSEWAQ